MTDLKKCVKRRTINKVAMVRRRLIVALLPGDVLAFREEGRRKWYETPISRVFVQVARWNAEAAIAERKRLRALRKKGGKP